MNRTEAMRKPTGLTAYVLGLGATAIIGAVAGGLAGMMTQAGIGGVAGTALCAAVALVGILAICIWWWRRVDEAAREAHKWAWWWGGTAGTAIGGVFLVVAVTAGRDQAPVASSVSAADMLYAGAVIILLCQVVGYGVAWAAWWLQRR